ncbi:MAG: ATP-binding protein [Alphaproteobacteria bacterium]|nr:ATP-binding protein [Alphaproteobacteria bacterium]
MSVYEELLSQLTDVAQSLKQIAEQQKTVTKLVTDYSGNGFVWEADEQYLRPLAKINAIDIELLRNIDYQKQVLTDNTRQFAKGLTANNVLLWGARGMGKSSLTKAVYELIGAEYAELKLVEIHREDISSLPLLMRQLAERDERFILYCDDLSFDAGDDSYKSLKAILEGGLEGKAENVIFYATSNRRHLLPREMIENEQANAINVRDTIDEKVSLSDRFGLWVGFHNPSQTEYLGMVSNYAAHFGFDITDEKLRRAALEWAASRGGRTGRVAWQFITNLAGQLGVKL